MPARPDSKPKLYRLWGRKRCPVSYPSKAIITTSTATATANTTTTTGSRGDRRVGKRESAENARRPRLKRDPVVGVRGQDQVHPRLCHRKLQQLLLIQQLPPPPPTPTLPVPLVFVGVPRPLLKQPPLGWVVGDRFVSPSLGGSCSWPPPRFSCLQMVVVLKEGGKLLAREPRQTRA